MTLPAPKGLYDPQFERDACGIGLVARLGGGPRHDVVAKALEALGRMAHRGAVGADADTGDGAGLLLQLPHSFFRDWAEAHRLALPEPGAYAVAMCFLPVDEAARRACEAALEAAALHGGFSPLGWRDVAVDDNAIGAPARAGRPIVRQLFVTCTGGDANEADVTARLLLARKRGVRLAARADFYVASFSRRTVVYKGLLRAERLAAFYPELADPRLTSRFAIVHARFSTNTFPSWARAQPLRGLAHNGEINTLRGNRAWMRAREGRFVAAGPFRGRGDDLLPVIEPGGSDSAALDNAVELLVAAGVPIARAIAMLVPAATEGRGVSREVRDFYEYHARLTEPWDGPAALCFTDGRLAGAALDRNGLRPLRYLRTEGGLVVVASESGAVDLGGERVVARGRLGPGGILLVDPEAGTLLCDDEVKAPLAAARPYGRLVEAARANIADPTPPPPAAKRADASALRGAAPAPAAFASPSAPAPAPAAFASPPAPAAAAPDPLLLGRLRLFGYTHEDVTLVLGPMARDGEEPVGSMGADVSLAALSEHPQLLFRYFKQHFAQVTNPPIDPVREASAMSLRTFVGPELVWFDAGDGASLELARPVLTPEALASLARVDRPGWRVETLAALFSPGSDPARSLRDALDGLAAAACRAVSRGALLVVLSDRDAGPGRAPLPSLLALGTVHHALVRAGLRSQASVVIDAGDAREVAHAALLIGYGASAICPRVAFEAIDDLCARGALGPIEAGRARENYVKALCKGLAKIIAKMGISTLAGYQGAQVFEAVGLNASIIDDYFEGTPSRLGGVGLVELAADVVRRSRGAFEQAEGRLPAGGVHHFRVEGERHLWTPEGVASLQRSVRLNDQEAYDRFASAINEPGPHPLTLRGLWALTPETSREPLPLDRVEPVAALLRRFATGAMSFGSISREAHETLALAMNRAGGRSNSGEGGEDEARYVPGPDGSSRRSAVKQVASGRFGVTAHYLVNADEIQIKIAQGAKPGEGGQLPGHKVDGVIARVRHSVPGVTLISPPPHHDIYSIEDLAQLIFDLKRVSPRARISVKLVAEAGVGAVAAGVAKAGANAILISGHDGGTGAAPLSSIHHAGLPWELGLAEAHQVLVTNGLRGRVRLQVDGQLRTGRDVVVAALLGAEEFGFATAPLVAVGCVLMRKCHLNTCPVGVATQDPVLRRRFEGTPEHVLRYFGFVADEARALLASLGLSGIDEAVGRVELLRPRAGLGPRAARLDTSLLLTRPDAPPGTAERLREGQLAPEHGTDLDLLTDAAPALEGRGPLRLRRRIGNVDRTYGAALSGELARRLGPGGLPDDSIVVDLEGSAGQSFGAFLAHGITLSLEGEANDYVGKGLSGGIIALRPAAGDPEGHVIAGNTLLYGATSGRAFLRGRAGERFAVRNSGASAVVEGVGDHGCEYMTGGIVVVLGPLGHNFGAGMSGGVAYLWRDALPEARRPHCLHADALAGLDESLDETDLRRLADLLREHAQRTGSPLALQLLADWPATAPRFLKIVPPEYRRALATGTAATAGPAGPAGIAANTGAATPRPAPHATAPTEHPKSSSTPSLREVARG